METVAINKITHIKKMSRIYIKLMAIVEKYKKYEAAASSSPSAPDTSKFTASHSGHISGGAMFAGSCMSHGEIFYVHLGYNVDESIKNKVESEVRELFRNENNESYKFTVSRSFGTNYSPITIRGFYTSNGVEYRFVFTRTQYEQIIRG